MDNEIDKLILQAVDGTIDSDDFETLQDAIERDPTVRDKYLRAVGLSESLKEIAAVELSGEHEASPAVAPPSARFLRLPILASLAALFLVMITAIAFWSGRSSVDRSSPPMALDARSEPLRESLIAGHATLRRSVDLIWSDGQASYREGDVLPKGLLSFDRGIAEIDLFCGATLIVEAPAAIDLESDWSIRVQRGRLRANVPPAARGFIVKAADSQIIDLGTEFALEVSPENARVEVIDGEVELRGGQHDGNRLVTGQGEWLRGTDQAIKPLIGLSTVGDVQRRLDEAEARRLQQWRQHVARLAGDDRLIAYYPIDTTSNDRVVRNASKHGDTRDGQLVGLVNQTQGRFGDASAGLEFDRPGSRVRTRIDGEFRAFTFAAWVRIDSLQHRYNALFMGDGYENGEPHWQIRDDGRLMFSVMVDDSKDVRFFNEREQRVVQDAGLHRVYMTEPIWDITKSGQWLHLAAVYDPAQKRVTQYVNGQQVDQQKIEDKFHVKTLRIGPAEIGNWGQPFRETPWFAVRNFNGTIDELAIFDAALQQDEIHELFVQGKPLGY